VILMTLVLIVLMIYARAAARKGRAEGRAMKGVRHYPGFLAITTAVPD
jgi:hypothetical protein